MDADNENRRDRVDETVEGNQDTLAAGAIAAGGGIMGTNLGGGVLGAAAGGAIASSATHDFATSGTGGTEADHNISDTPGTYAGGGATGTPEDMPSSEDLDKLRRDT